jgi:hypothetical protein
MVKLIKKGYNQKTNKERLERIKNYKKDKHD